MLWRCFSFLLMHGQGSWFDLIGKCLKLNTRSGGSPSSRAVLFNIHQELNVKLWKVESVKLVAWRNKTKELNLTVNLLFKVLQGGSTKYQWFWIKCSQNFSFYIHVLISKITNIHHVNFSYSVWVVLHFYCNEIRTNPGLWRFCFSRSTGVLYLQLLKENYIKYNNIYILLLNLWSYNAYKNKALRYVFEHLWNLKFIHVIL